MQVEVLVGKALVQRRDHGRRQGTGNESIGGMLCWGSKGFESVIR